MTDEKEKSDLAAKETGPAETGPTEESLAKAAEGAPDVDPALASPAQDVLTQEALARRVEALGSEDETDKIARAEEEKLQQRTSKLKKKGNKLADDAHKRLERIGEKGAKRRAAGDDDDVGGRRVVPPMVSGDDGPAVEWVKKNGRMVAIVGAAVIAAGIGFAIYASMNASKAEVASAELSSAVEDTQAEIGDPDKRKEGMPDMPMFKTVEERREAALTKFRGVEAKFPGSGQGYLAQLAEGALLLDKRDADGALKAFQSVKDSVLGKVDKEVMGRALEGMGFAYELKAAGTADKPGDPRQLDEAQKTFHELENTDTSGFKELGMYHQARILETKGDKVKAIEILKQLKERIEKPGADHPFSRYLEIVAIDRLRALDPQAVPPKNPGMMSMGANGMKGIDPAQIRQMMEQQAKQKAAAGHHEGH